MESESESVPVPASCFEIDHVYAPEAVVPLVRELLQRLSDGLPSAIDTERGREALRQGIVPPLLDCLSNLQHFRSMPSISIDELATREKSSSRREEELNQDLARVEAIIRGITLRLDWMKDPHDPSTFLENMSIHDVGRFVEWRILQLRDCVKHYAGLNYKLWEDTQNLAQENGRLKEEAADGVKGRLSAEEELRREKERLAEEVDRLEAQLSIVQQENCDLVGANMELKAKNTSLVHEGRTRAEKQKALRAEHDKSVASLEAEIGALKDNLQRKEDNLQRKEDECKNVRATLADLQANYGCERAAHHDAREKLRGYKEHSGGSKVDHKHVEDLKLQVKRLESSLHEEKSLRQREKDEYETALKTQSAKHAREVSTLKIDLEQSRHRLEDVVKQHNEEICTKDADSQSQMTEAQNEAEAALNEQREQYENQIRQQESEHELKMADMLDKVKEAQDKADQAQKEVSRLRKELEELQEESDAFPQLIQETFHRVFTPRTKESLAPEVPASFEEQLLNPSRTRAHAEVDPSTPTPSNAKRPRLGDYTHVPVDATVASADLTPQRDQVNSAGVEEAATVAPRANGASQSGPLMPPPSSRVPLSTPRVPPSGSSVQRRRPWGYRVPG
jgi:predicted  nucleic acid-binding Zn-ribbon protein